MAPSLRTFFPRRGRSPRDRRRAWLPLAAGLAAFALSASSPQADGAADEYLVKAAFLEKFCRYVEWPPRGEGEGAFDIAVIGENPFGGALRQLAESVRIQNRAIRLHDVKTLADLGSCQLLFVARSESARLAGIVDSLRAKPVLLVGDSPGFAAAGVHINFYISGQGSVRFEVNPDRFAQSGLRVDTYLLEYARVVR